MERVNYVSASNAVPYEPFQGNTAAHSHPTFLPTALRLFEMGLVPVLIRPGDKKPVEAGFTKHYVASDKADLERPSEFRITRAVLERWAREVPLAGVGLLCGKAVVADIDDAEIWPLIADLLPRTQPCKHGQRGFSLIYLNDPADPITRTRTFANRFAGEMMLELLAHGRQTVLPPTMHPNAQRPYAWVSNPWGDPAAALWDCPPDAVALIGQRHVDAIEARLIERGLLKARPLGCGGCRPLGVTLADTERRRYEAYVSPKIAERLASVRGAASGGRQDALNGAVYALAMWVREGFIPEDRLEAEMRAACLENGYIREDGERAFARQFTKALEDGWDKPLPDLDAGRAERMLGAAPAQMYAPGFGTPRVPTVEQRCVTPATAYGPASPVPPASPMPMGFIQPAQIHAPGYAPPAIQRGFLPARFPAEYEIRPRPFIMGPSYMRGYISGTVAPSKGGKTALVMLELLTLASGKPIMSGQHAPRRPQRVLIISEDPVDELERRCTAIMKHYGLTRELIGDRLFMDSFRRRETRLVNARGEVMPETVAALKADIRELRLDVVVFDPVKKLHAASENDNTAMDVLFTVLNQIAEECNCAIHLIIHTRKATPGQPLTVNDIRGASSQIGAARHVRVIARMTKEQAKRLDVPDDEHWRYLCEADAEGNMTKPAASMLWYRLNSVMLNNACEDPEADNNQPDDIQVIGPWFPKTTSSAEGLSEEHELEVMTKLEAHGPIYRRNPQAGNWIGTMIGDVIGESLNTHTGKKRVEAMLTAWIDKDYVASEMLPDAKRELRPTIVFVSYPGVLAPNAPHRRT